MSRQTPTYPAGRCDQLSGGLALAPGQVPAHFGVIGRSLADEPIWAEHWGSIDGPQVLLVSGVHGNECSPRIMVDAVRTHPPKGYGIWMIPLLNPDGYVRYTRANAAGVDLNTDGARQSQPETMALMAMTEQLQPVLTIHLHSPNGFIGWFGTGTYRIADPVTSVAPLSYSIATNVAARTELRLDGAGFRYGADSFLWQGQLGVSPRQEAVLVELFAVSNAEVLGATPRPPTRRPEQIAAMSVELLDVLESALTNGR